MNINRSIYKYSFLLLALYMGISYTRSFLPSQNILLVSIDPLISEQEQEKIVIACQGYVSDKAAPFFASLEQQFPQIKQIAITEEPCGIKKIAIASYVPQARINGDMVITEQGTIEPAVQYDSSFTNQLVNISVHDAQQHTFKKELVNYLQLTAPNIYEHFNVSWQRPTNITLQNKQENNFVITCDDSQVLDQSCIKQCETVYRELKANKKKSQHVITDVRFDHQIIAYLKEGEFHGHHII